MTHINQRRDTAANWTAADPVLHLGEVGWETDTRKAKLGDGVTAWTTLDYIVEGEVTSVNGQQGDVVLDKSDVGLGSADNVPDASKPVSTFQQAAIDSAVAAAVTQVLLDSHPVGSIYMSADPTDPSTLFGGTWAAWGSGRVPVGYDSGDTDFDVVEETGGAKEHTLTVSEMPSHNHNITHAHGSNSTAVDGGSTLAFRRSDNVSPTTGGGMVQSFTGNSATTGDGNPHNIMQPYIVCHMWKRTA